MPDRNKPTMREIAHERLRRVVDDMQRTNPNHPRLNELWDLLVRVSPNQGPGSEVSRAATTAEPERIEQPGQATDPTDLDRQIAAIIKLAHRPEHEAEYEAAQLRLLELLNQQDQRKKAG